VVSMLSTLLFGSMMRYVMVTSAAVKSVSLKRTVESGMTTICAHNNTNGDYVWTARSVLTMSPSFWSTDEKSSASAIRATHVFEHVLARLRSTRP